jgi:eukaryotic-like serine/threonine-protein kinase
MNHTTESFLRIEAIFHEALAAEPAARASLIADRCANDMEMAAEVTQLLRASEEEEQVTRAGRGEEAREGPVHKRVGPYRIDRLLGRGGMGAVYLAQRADGQFEQKVAIKLIDLPLATDLFRERFRQERQILAGLQHPYIARLLDGGVTEGGDLYLAMEYVDGVPIHKYCLEHGLNTMQRLALFAQVCQAVQFAHQNLIVHRDLKPDNIFVAEDGTPKLLDFGTAKLISPSLSGQEGELTRHGFTSFTPQYASPEQVLGNPITTASDTYSLGVLLYRLLTGSHPYELKEMTTAEMVRVICEEPPRKPTTEDGTQRRLDPDLVAILLKALRKEPGERYLTAEQLAADIQAWLGGHPVAARRGTFRYRAEKFIRRNWIALSGAALLAVTLAAGVAGVLWQSRVANEQRRRAEARSADLRQLSDSLLSELDEAIKQLPGSTGAQKLLVTRVLEHLDRMAADAHGDRATQLDLADAYTRLGNLQGNPYDQNVGDTPGALASMNKAIALAAPIAAANANDTAALRALAMARESRSEILFGAGSTHEAIDAMQAALPAFDKLIEPANTPVAQLGEVASVYGTYGDELGQPGTSSLNDSAAALKAYRHVIELDERALSIDAKFMRARRGLAIQQMKIANVEFDFDPAQALADYRAAQARLDDLPASEKDTMFVKRVRAYIVRREAGAMSELGEYDTAAPLYAQSEQIDRKYSAADPQDLRAMQDLEVVLDDESTSEEYAADPVIGVAPEQRRQHLLKAIAYLNAVNEVTSTMVRKDPSNPQWKGLDGNARVRLGLDRLAAGQSAGSDALISGGIAELKELVSKPDASALLVDQATRVLVRLGGTPFADPALTMSCAERGAALTQRKIPAWLNELAQAYRIAGQPEKARAAAKDGLALLPPLRPGDPKSRVRRVLELEAK